MLTTCHALDSSVTNQHTGSSCTLCSECGIDDALDEKQRVPLLVCEVCETRTHPHCVVPSLPSVPSGGWICAACVECRLCGTTRPEGDGSVVSPVVYWMFDYTMCYPCGMKYAARQHCPVCDEV